MTLNPKLCSWYLMGSGGEQNPKFETLNLGQNPKFETLNLVQNPKVESLNPQVYSHVIRR